MKLFAVLVVVTACGSSSAAKSPDAPLVADAPAEVDALPSGSVAVHVVIAGQPQVGATIVFSAPTGEVAATATSDNNGGANGTITAGGSLTAEVVTGSQPNATHTLFTAFDVQPGDNITLGTNSGPPPTGADDGNVQVSYASTVNNATAYTSDIGCSSMSGATTTAITMPITGSCLAAGGTFDVISTATDTNGNLLGYAVQSNVTPAGAGNTVNKTMPAWGTSTASDTVTLSNGPATQAVVAHVKMHHDPVVYGHWPVTQATTNGGGGASVALTWPQSVGSAVSWDLKVSYPSSVSGMPSKSYGKRTSTLTSTTQAIDLSVMPTMTSQTVIVPSGHDTPMASWTSSGTMPTVQGTLVSMTWHINNIGTFTWTGAARGDVTSVQFPRLPDSLAIDRVAVNQAYDQEQVTIVQSDLFADFAAFRSSYGDVLSPPARNYNYALTAIQ
jgi:hypothetical protein